MVLALINAVFGKISKAVGGSEELLPKFLAWTGIETAKLSGKSGVS